MATKKYVSLSKLSDFLDNLKNTFASLIHKHTLSDISDYEVDASLSSTSNNPVANSVLDAEFESIATAMNALESAIDGKADSSHNHDDRYYTEGEVDELVLSHTHSYDDLEDKPFYEGAGYFSILDDGEATVNFYEWGGGVYGAAITDVSKQLTQDLFYKVIWDDVEYTATCTYSGNNEAGNPITSVGAPYGDYSTYPFGIDTYMSADGTYDFSIHTNSTDAIHTIDVHEYGNKVFMLDEKYIPDSIARTADINAELDSINSNLDAKSTATNLVNGSADGSLRSISAAAEDDSYTMGQYAFAVGNQSKASGVSSFAEGQGTAVGDASHAEGMGIADGLLAHAEGSSVAVGEASHAEGSASTATGDYSHAEGNSTAANGINSHAEGLHTIAAGDGQHVQGHWNISDTTSAHIVGNGTDINNPSNAHTLDWEGNAWFQGDVYISSTSGTNKDEGSMKLTTENYVNTAVETHNLDTQSHIDIRNELDTKSTATNLVNGSAFGSLKSVGSSEESDEYVIGADAIAIGSETKASGWSSHAEGVVSEANGVASHAEGFSAIANGEVSHAEGFYTIANGNNQHVQGAYNIEDENNTYAHIVGNGTEEERSNAHTLDWDGNAWFAGDVYVGGTSQEDATKVLTTEDYNIYTQSEEPADAPIGSLWIDTDADTSEDFTLNEVKYTPQELTDEQKEQARFNIGMEDAVMYKGELNNTYDLDNIQEIGYYFISTGDNQPANYPFAGSAGILEVIGRPNVGSQLFQRVTRYGANESAFRGLSGSGWTIWDSNYTTNDTIPISNGGTGATSARAAEYNISKDIEELLTDMNDDTMYICKRGSTLSASNGAFGYRTGGNLWTWIASKIRSVFGFSSSNILPISNGGTSAGTVLGTLTNLNMLPNTWYTKGVTPRGFVPIHTNITSVPWYTSGMSTFQFVDAMPTYSAVLCHANAKSLSDQPTTYCTYFFYKGTSTYYNLAFCKTVNTSSPNLWVYGCNDSSGTWVKLTN